MLRVVLLVVILATPVLILLGLAWILARAAVDTEGEGGDWPNE